MNIRKFTTPLSASRAFGLVRRGVVGPGVKAALGQSFGKVLAQIATEFHARIRAACKTQHDPSPGLVFGGLAKNATRRQSKAIGRIPDRLPSGRCGKGECLVFGEGFEERIPVLSFWIARHPM